MNTISTIAAISAVAAVSACGSSAQLAPKTDVNKYVLMDSAEPAQMSKPDDKGTSGMVSISDDVKNACGISADEAYFAFDSADVRPRDRQTLDKLRVCFTSGPLKGHAMKLIGHADPRGDDDYNLALGGKRADSVKQVIVEQGMPSSKVITSSRGEMDAMGIDESSWTRDRRVDVLAGNG